MSTAEFHLAQVNIARMKAPMDDPLMARFVEWLAPINALAERSPGYVWRLQSAEGDATASSICSVMASRHAPSLFHKLFHL